MSDIVSRLNSLNIENAFLKSKVQGYFLRLQSTKDFFIVKQNGICIKDITGSNYLMLERFKIEEKILVICKKCMDKRPIESASKLQKLDISLKNLPIFKII